MSKLKVKQLRNQKWYYVLEDKTAIISISEETDISNMNFYDVTILPDKHYEKFSNKKVAKALQTFMESEYYIPDTIYIRVEKVVVDIDTDYLENLEESIKEVRDTLEQ